MGESDEWVEAMKCGWAGPNKGSWADRCYRQAQVRSTGASRCSKVYKWMLEVGISVCGHYRVQAGASAYGQYGIQDCLCH